MRLGLGFVLLFSLVGVFAGHQSDPDLCSKEAAGESWLQRVASRERLCPPTQGFYSNPGSRCCKNAHVVAARAGQVRRADLSSTASERVKAGPERSSQSTPSMGSLTSEPREWQVKKEWRVARGEWPVVSESEGRELTLHACAGSGSGLPSPPVLFDRRSSQSPTVGAAPGDPRSAEAGLLVSDLFSPKKDLTPIILTPIIPLVAIARGFNQRRRRPRCVRPRRPRPLPPGRRTSRRGSHRRRRSTGPGQSNGSDPSRREMTAGRPAWRW